MKGAVYQKLLKNINDLSISQKLVEKNYFYKKKTIKLKIIGYIFSVRLHLKT